MPGSKLPLFPYNRGETHQPNSVGVYIPIRIPIPIEGGRFPIPNIATFDHGTCVFMFVDPRDVRFFLPQARVV